MHPTVRSFLSVCCAPMLLASCGETPTDPGPAGACMPAVRVGGTIYEVRTVPEPSVVRATPFALVRRRVPCVDTPGAAPRALREGESTFLPAGTGLHVIVGEPPGERIAVRFQEEERWVVLEAIHT